MTPHELRHELQALARSVDRVETYLCKRIRMTAIIPFCDRTGMRFTAGMGQWSFDKLDRYDTRQYYSAGDDKIPKRLNALLCEKLVSNYSQDIGSMVDDYTPPNYKD